MTLIPESRSDSFDTGSASPGPESAGGTVSDTPTPASTFFDSMDAGRELGKSLPSTSHLSAPDSGPLNREQFTQPTAPVSGSQSKPKRASATEAHSARYNAAATAASGSAL